jgi:L-asparaginase
MSDDDRKLILEVCRVTDVNRIVITHGTDTIIQTAQVLSSLKAKTIVLTGALSPELFKNSDAEFNLGVAVGAVSVLSEGVYIAMQGTVMKWDEAAFDSDTGQFTQKSKV